MARIARFMHVCAVAALALSAARASGQAHGASYRNRLLGVYSQSGDPIEGAEVIDIVGKTTALTTRTGTVTLAYLPDGASLVRIQKLGYRPVTILVSISPADTVPLTIILSSFAQMLPAVDTKDSSRRYISPRLRDFEERRNQGGGYFVGEDELRKGDNPRMTGVVQKLPGLVINCSVYTPRRCFAVTHRAGARNSSCPVTVYVDGVSANENNLEEMRPDEYAGVEFYAGGASIPMQYNKTGSACGVLLFWTRER